MRDLIRAFVIGAGVAIIVGLFQGGYTGWASVITMMVFIYIFERLNVSQKVPKKLPAYRIRLSISPNWKEILPIKTKGHENPESFLVNMVDDKELDIDEKQSLFGKEFSYVIYTDEASGVEQIWSNYYKTFVDNLEVRGFIIYGNIEKIQKKYNINYDHDSDYLIIYPWEMGYPHKYAPDISLDHERILAKIPYGRIIEHLKKLHATWGDAMRGILKFPDELQKEFDKHGVKYETWDVEDYGTGIGFQGKPLEEKYAKHVKKIGFEISDDRMSSHGFSTKYYSIFINIEFFDRGEV